MDRNDNDMVFIQLNGEPRELVMGHRAMKMMEKLLGVSIGDISIDGMDCEAVEKVFYCLLLSDCAKRGETLELADMEALLDGVRPYGLLIEKMGEAFEKAFPEQDPNAGRAAGSGAGTKATALPPASASRKKNTKK